jgi:hypothetical protein
MRIEAMLRHLGSGADLRDLPTSASQKVALVKTANQRGLIAWHKSRGRYELTTAGWCELAPSRRFGLGSIMVGTTLGATLGAAALAVFWLTAGAAHVSGPAPRSAAAPAPAQVAKLSAPAVSGAASEPALLASVSSPAQATTGSASPPGGSPVTAPAREVPPAAAPAEAEPTKVADEPTPEQLAEAAKAKQVAAKKARQRAAARRRREEAARTWAAGESRTREAEYSGHGVFGGYGGYGSGNSWFAYR